MRLKIGSRKSDLARVQAFMVGDALQQSNKNLEIEYDFRESLGDKNQADPLWQMPAKGVFTEDFYDGLCNGRWDLVVHSWKDLPVEERERTKIVATLPRADARDILIVPRKYIAKISESKELRVLSSSPRRQHNLKSFLSEVIPVLDLRVEFHDIRGNVQTRLRKLLSGEGDALVMAKAALDRMLLAEREEFSETRNFMHEVMQESNWMILPASINPAAAAQGALAIEISRERKDLEPILNKINCEETFTLVQSERSIHSMLGGGCHQKIGVNYYSHAEGNIISIRGETESGTALATFDILPKEELKKATFAKEYLEKTLVMANKSEAVHPSREGAENFWPNIKDKQQLFDRKRVEAELSLDDASAILITKINAMPPKFSAPKGVLLWSSGIQTWKKLAELGYWVNGTLDSLGESTLPRSLPWLESALDWVKFTHSQSPKREGIRNIATYSLEPKSKLEGDLRNYDRFFWMSGTQFTEALRHWPELREKEHNCGPGNTLQELRSILGEDREIGLFLSLDDWIQFQSRRRNS